ncbi:protein-L-histidine N-pros-methyltransferase-like [Diadema setosum]|uniref:protein-L-histidine N-pros-methyltransferase-like n=1 Tax=Diadema setosum TaxID=31175 RepID=UPI003B3AAF9E
MATPRIRNPMLRAIYEHNTNERFQRSCLHKFYDINKWYSCDLNKLPQWLSTKFVQCSLDQGTELFLDQCYEKSGWFLTQAWHSVAKGFLTYVMSPTSANGLLRRGSMFVFSRDQFTRLLGVSETWRGDRVMDLGAGDGEVTKEMEAFFEEVYTTEVSWPMQWRLSGRGYKVLPTEEWSHMKSGHTYDVIGCLNLLDRCDRPLTLLADMRASLSHSGVVVIAVVLPFKQYVETGAPGNRPSEVIEVKGKHWEEQVQRLVEEVFHPAGYQVRSFSRVPYLCEGDATTPFYLLDDALFVLEAKKDAVAEDS